MVMCSGGQLLDVVSLLADEGYTSRHFWIVGELSANAENFMTEVCEWSRTCGEKS